MDEQEKISLIAEEIQKAVQARIKEIYSPQALEYIENTINRGVVTQANGFGVYRGLCGDTMKIYLKIEDDRIMDASFDTDGCEATLAAGCTVTQLSKGRSISESLEISPHMILDHLGGLPPDHIHCSILAATTFLNAVANYLILNLE